MKLTQSFFDRDANLVALELLGKVLRVKFQNIWLSAQIIETESYYLLDKGSHASLGFTEKRKALFMPAGTIYMYYARGKDSLNISCQGEGNAVLIKAAHVYIDSLSPKENILSMQSLNPLPNNKPRQLDFLCSGQTLLCQSLNLKVKDWDQKQFDAGKFYSEDVSYKPEKIIQTTRLGISAHRDPHLPFRFIDLAFADFCTDNPLKRKQAQYTIYPFQLARNHLLSAVYLPLK